MSRAQNSSFSTPWLGNRSLLIAAICFFCCGCIFAFDAAFAQEPNDTVQSGLKSPPQPNDCVTQGANYHQVNPWVVRAILKVESNFKPNAVNRNRNGSIDVGIAQINSQHFKELAQYGIAPQDLLDACKGSYIAAWHLKKKMAAYGNTWFAIGAYNSTTPCYNARYSALVWNTLVSWSVIDSKMATVPSLAQCDTSSYRGVASDAGRGNPSAIAFDSSK